MGESTAELSETHSAMTGRLTPAMKQMVRGNDRVHGALQITHQQPLSEALAETVQLLQEVCTFAVLC